MDKKEIIAEAIKVIKSGGVILYPTDTVWGLGCDATNDAAVEKIYQIKQRANSKSLVVLAYDMQMVAKYVKQIPSIAVDLVEVNDAPMTIVYPGAEFLSSKVVAEDGSAAIRVPLAEDDDFCRELLYRLRLPLVSTSANVSGEATPSSFAEISKEIIEAVDFVVPRNFGSKSTGKASQIIKLGLDGEVEIIRA